MVEQSENNVTYTSSTPRAKGNRGRFGDRSQHVKGCWHLPSVNKPWSPKAVVATGPNNAMLPTRCSARAEQRFPQPGTRRDRPGMGVVTGAGFKLCSCPLGALRLSKEQQGLSL